jgi:competence protein ComEC
MKAPSTKCREYACSSGSISDTGACKMANSLFPRPVIPILASLIAGITMGILKPGHWFTAFSVVLVCTVFTIRCMKKKKCPWPIPILLFLALGYLSLQPWVSPFLPENHISFLSGPHKLKIKGVVTTRPVVTDHRTRFILQVTGMEKNDIMVPARGNIRVTVMDALHHFQRGDTLVFKSKIRPIRNFNNPGGFDYQQYMKLKGVTGSAYVADDSVTHLDGATEKRFNRTIDRYRQLIIALIDEHAPGDEGRVLKALVVGDKSAMGNQLRNRFNRAGIGHLLAISGLHIGIIATVTFKMFVKFLTFSPALLFAARVRKIAALLTLIPVLVYGLLSGMAPSAQRAVIMVTLFLGAIVAERDNDPVNTLALAALLILSLYPQSLFSISFQLSFTAVFVILYGLPIIKSWRFLGRDEEPNRPLKRLINTIIVFTWVSFLAISGTLPLVAFYFNQISLVGLLSNLIFVPLVGFGVVPLGLLAAFLYPLSIVAAEIFIRTGAAILTPALDLAEKIAEMPLAALKTPTPNVAEICAYYLTLWAILEFIKLSKRKPSINPVPIALPAGETSGRTLERVTWRDSGIIIALGRFFSSAPGNGKWIPGLILVISLFFWMADAAFWIQKRYGSDNLKVTFLDVGQGSAALIEMPHGATMLLDGGGFADNSRFDMGARVIAPFLWRRKIMTIDTVVLSHPNSDHLNGLLYILESFHVKNFISNGETADTLGYKKFLDIKNRHRINTPHFLDLPKLHRKNRIEISILNPPADFKVLAKRESWRNLNNNSLVVRMEYGAHSFLFPGDIEAKAEREILAIHGDKLKSAILLAPHHGSKSSSLGTFLRGVRPRAVVVSCGWKNRYHMPHKEVMGRYRTLGARILRTDLSGAVAISSNGRELHLSTFSDPSIQTILEHPAASHGESASVKESFLF